MEETNASEFDVGVYRFTNKIPESVKPEFDPNLYGLTTINNYSDGRVLRPLYGKGDIYQLTTVDPECKLVIINNHDSNKNITFNLKPGIHFILKCALNICTTYIEHNTYPDYEVKRYVFYGHPPPTKCFSKLRIYSEWSGIKFYYEGGFAYLISEKDITPVKKTIYIHSKVNNHDEVEICKLCHQTIPTKKKSINFPREMDKIKRSIHRCLDQGILEKI